MWLRAGCFSLLAALLAVQVFWLGETLHHLHFVLRPDANGAWYIQDDVDHRARGVDTKVRQTEEFLEINFLRRYSHAGSIQVTPDDGFHGVVTVGSNLGVTGARIRLKVGDVQIDPATIWSHGAPPGDGNIWGTVAMVHHRTWSTEYARLRENFRTLFAD